MSEEEACCFLRQSDMLVYYTKALHLTKIIGKRGQGSLYNYFGPIDYAKLKSHLDLFLKASISLNIQSIINTIMEIKSLL
jgi:hypothetical protein